MRRGEQRYTQGYGSQREQQENWDRVVKAEESVASCEPGLEEDRSMRRVFAVNDETVTDKVSVPTGGQSPNALAGNISPDAGDFPRSP